MDEYTNKMYEDFKTRDVLDGISADNFDSLKNDAFITPENKEFFEDMLRVGYLSGQISSSGPMPNTSFNIEVSVTGSGAGNGKDVFSPKAGEVYKVQTVSTSEDVTSNPIIYIGAKDSAGVVAYFIVDTSAGSPHVPDNENNNSFFIDQNMTLFCYAFATFPVGSSVDFTFNLIRVR